MIEDKSGRSDRSGISKGQQNIMKAKTKIWNSQVGVDWRRSNDPLENTYTWILSLTAIYWYSIQSQ